MPAISVRCWGEQCVAYDPRSGDTYLLGELAGQVLACAQVEDVDFAGLLGKTSRTLDIEPDDEFAAGLLAVVAELQDKGLLSRSCCSPN